MNRTAALLVGLVTSLAAASWAVADATATIENTHLCCNSCVKGVDKAVSAVEGAKAACDKKAGTITVTAPDAATAQKAVDAIVAAGYYGKATGAEIKEDSGAASGSVKSATVTGFHNCCKKCSTAINGVIKSVPGASGEVAAKAETVTVTGDFDAAKLAKAFEDAGFHVKVDAK